MASYRDTVLALAVCAVLIAQGYSSNEFRVGGRRGWVVPSGSETETYNQWAERNRFQVGDNIYFKYRRGEDSVLQVEEDDYNNCNGSNPIAAYDEGNTVIKFRQSGNFYFISGEPGHCENGQKIHIVVMAEDDSSSRAPAPGTSEQTGEAASASTYNTPHSNSPAPSNLAGTALAYAASFVILLHFLVL